MKINVKKMSYDEVMALPAAPRQKPARPGAALRKLVNIGTKGDLKATNFTYRMIGMEQLSKNEPALILMNHSSFIDLKIAAEIFKDRPYQIVCTSDGFVGKSKLMRGIGCIPTNKFVQDVALVKDIVYAAKTLKTSILMYPEASYSFDGTATPLPDSIGKCVKLMGIPVVMVRTYGAFHRDPLYNNLQIRKVNVSADVTYLLSAYDTREKSPEELQEIINSQFSFDNFKWQQENNILISEDFRADCLNRVLYKCPACLAEGETEGKGIYLTCHACGTKYELSETGFMKKVIDQSSEASVADLIDPSTEFPHIPDWYAWERACVRKELMSNTYSLSEDVDIYILRDLDCLYQVGEGHLTHTKEGFHLTGCDGKLDYFQKPKASYSLYADYYWYEMGDMICIGNAKILYYCFPKSGKDIVAKTRLATEELYKMLV